MRGYAGKIWLITAAGLVARLALIGYQPLWRDEAFTALAVQRPLGPMLDVVRNDSAPPLFYLVERLFAVASSSPEMLRVLPVLAGVAAIPIIAALGRRVAGDAGGIWAAVIGAIAPALVVSSLDARMYMLATTLVLASTLCLLRALERPSALRWALYATCAILAVYTVYFALFAVLAQVITVARALPARADSIGARGRRARRAHRGQPRSVGGRRSGAAQPHRRRVLGAEARRRQPAGRPRAVLHRTAGEHLGQRFRGGEGDWSSPPT